MFKKLFLITLLALVPQLTLAQTTGIQAQSSVAIEGSHTFCTGTCKLYTLTVTSGASSGYLMLFDANSIPADGTLATLPKYCWAFSATTSNSYTWTYPVIFNNGLIAVFSTSGCGTKAISATAMFTAQAQ